MASSPEEQLASMIANMKKNTGKSLEEWLAAAAHMKGAKHGEIVKFLKGEHGLGHGFANVVAHELLRGDAPPAGAEDLVGAQYSGKKEALRPLYDRLAGEVAKLGPDVELSPKKTCVSFRRSKQFGLVQPGAGRLDVGICLKGVEPSGRLEAAGSFNAMVSHRVRVTAESEVDAELLGWLRAAYEQA
ncbi:MAG: DUF4287 domain-containing protein [Candidatus Sumerlaeia bacterium]|nr:DUF4287 domain-containing protein [Candidatus Sumerlaeia bacterium]